MSITIFHNPRCSKSRQALALLETAGVDVKIVRYLEHTPSLNELKNIVAKLGIAPRDLLRKGEGDYQRLGLSDTSLSDDQILAAMVEYPKLIERPIVIRGDRAVIGRPPEIVNSLL